nr:MAG TPA: putative membrane protein [Bacteriophage sp.]DAG25764.1 MAG TPA: putative membrane protein [Bacteriophage sp.]DAH14145.1 MAG TPA: putative membrane protein [Caudoviricetes sp.]DAN23292.1 MAG TPA_asm: putative membrane protein [Bacteriophage sp.]
MEIITNRSTLKQPVYKVLKLEVPSYGLILKI